LTGRRLVFVFLLGGCSLLHGQARTTASRAGDAQVGAGFAFGKSDYIPGTFRGVSAYADFDFSRHLGVEAGFHQIDTPNGDESYQRTYEIGARYFRSYGPLAPYVRGMIGRGDFNYPHGLADLSYNLFAVGAGADLKLGEHLRVRGDYEWQRWSSFPNGGLMPQLVTIGVAYHFTGVRRDR
jgi:opacity protein-like surface antigen